MDKDIDDQDYDSLGLEGFIDKTRDYREDISHEQMKQHPYQSLLSVVAIVENNICQGTAFLISEQYAITVAHCILDETGSIYKDIRLFLAPKGQIDLNQTQPNELKISDFRFLDQFLKHRQTERKQKVKNESTLNPFDLALIKISPPIPQKEYILIPPQPFDLSSLQFQVSGISSQISYGRKCSIAQPKTCHGKIGKINNGIITHKMDTSKSQSGSPILTTKNGKRYAIGVHFHFYGNKKERSNFGIYFSEQNVKLLNTWKNQMSNDTNFQFNWIQVPQQGHSIKIEGKKVEKVDKFYQKSCILSSQPIPKEQSLNLHVKINNIHPEGMIWIGLLTNQIKFLIQQGNPGEWLIDQGFLGCQITRKSLKIFSNYSLVKHYNIKFEESMNIFLRIDVKKNQISVFKDKQELQIDQIKKPMYQIGGVKSYYLCAMLQEKGDSFTII